ncbi:MAG TPA: hypothetical protein VJN63_05570 [Thermoplasmata archaeon]|nr:hypothetical protein [Thermoplasmata archaeon]
MSAPPPPPGVYPPGYYQAPRPSRPIGVSILAILVVLGGVLFLLSGIAILLFSAAFALGGLGIFGLAGSILGGIVLIFGIIWIAVGLGLWNLRGWAWWLAVIVMVLTILGGISAPAVIVIPLLILIYLILVRNHFR